MLRSHTSVMIPPALRGLAERPSKDVLLVCAGMVYRRDSIDRLHSSTPHQLDLWRVRNEPAAHGRRPRRDGGPSRGSPHSRPTSPFAPSGTSVHHSRKAGRCASRRRVGRGRRMRARPSGGAGRRGVGGLHRSRYWCRARPPAHDPKGDPRHPAPPVEGSADRLTDARPGAHTGRCRPIHPSAATYPSRSASPTTLRSLATGSARHWGKTPRRRDDPGPLRDSALPISRQRRWSGWGCDPVQKNVLIEIVLRDLERTLTDEDANQLRDRIYDSLHQGDPVPVAR